MGRMIWESGDLSGSFEKRLEEGTFDLCMYFISAGYFKVSIFLVEAFFF